MQTLTRSALWLQRFLNTPYRVFIFCLIFGCVGLLANGSVLNLYALHRDLGMLTQQIQSTREHNIQLEHQLKMAQDPTYIARTATDRYDLVDEHDLIFVFSED